jgi:hypothetical protein
VLSFYYHTNNNTLIRSDPFAYCSATVVGTPDDKSIISPHHGVMENENAFVAASAA